MVHCGITLEDYACGTMCVQTLWDYTCPNTVGLLMSQHCGTIRVQTL